MSARRARRTQRDEKPKRQSHGFLSSWISRAWWDPKAELCEVESTDGVRWLYYDVDAGMWADFKQAKSAGSFVRRVLERQPNNRR